jgi:hypothetical protein
MRAQFEVRPLDANATHVYPEEAVKCSSSAFDMLNVLHGEAEDARNAREYIQRPCTVHMMKRDQYCQTLQSTHVTYLSGVTTTTARVSSYLWF